MAKLTVAQKRARLFEFADFLDSLKEEKFNISKWCKPDHTCKTVACIAGWAGINYSQRCKTFISQMYEVQILLKEVDELFRVETLSEAELKAACAKRKRLRLKINRTHAKEPSWENIGRIVLGLDYVTAENLFYSSYEFWYYFRGNVTNKMAAKAIRYIACHPKHRLISPEKTTEDDNFSYDANVMDKFIAENIGKYKLAA